MEILYMMWRFFLTGLFAVGGGLATMPFLTEIGSDSGWFTAQDLANMIAVSESTPGPMGVNMATYVGYSVFGLPGGVLSTLSLVFPSLVVIICVAKMMEKFRSSKLVQAVFEGLRPASMAMITAAGLSVAKTTLLNLGAPMPIRPVEIALCVLLFFAMKKWKKLHPICFICIAGAAGVLLGAMGLIG